MTSNSSIVDEQAQNFQDGSVIFVRGNFSIVVSTDLHNKGTLLDDKYLIVPLTNKAEVELIIEKYSLTWDDEDEDCYGYLELNVCFPLECDSAESLIAANYTLSELTERLNYICGKSDDGRFVRYEVIRFEIEWYE